MDTKEFKSAEGSCIISEDVLASIACTAASEIPGVAAMARNVSDIRGIITTNAASRSVRVLHTENETVLDVYVTLREGAKIQETGSQVQQAVKAAVQAMTGRPVTRVNVHVEGMVPEEKEA